MSLVKRLYNYWLSSDKYFVQKITRITGAIPNNLELFKLAFYHKSQNDREVEGYESNERLEFLGDAILSSIVGEYLFKKYPANDEGFLTKMRSKIVKRTTLNNLAYEMNLDDLFAEYNDVNLSHSMMGNTLEALIGAFYLEKGYGRTKQFVINRVLNRFINVKKLEKENDNFKSQLLEWGQKEGNDIEFVMLSKMRIESRDKFKVAVQVNGKKIGEGEDYNKKSAEQMASMGTLKKIGLIK